MTEPSEEALPESRPDGLYRVTSEAETRALARALAPLLRPGDVLALEGDLGAGKTAFARALINALPHPDGSYVEEEVPSPTFTLVQTYNRQTYNRRPAEVWHVDLYRIERPEDALELGLEEAFSEAICLIEWPERLGPLLPAKALSVRIMLRGDERHVRLSGPDPWPERLAGAGLRASQ